MAYNTSSQYKQVIYSQDCRHKLRIWFNNVELEDADTYCEKLTVSSRILPTGSKVFNLDNFVSKEVTLILHDVPLSSIVDQVKISLGTLVNDEYEYVPLGVFNIQDKPTTDKDKTTIKLRDNSVKFDINYNAKPVIDANGGTATKLQIFQNICSTCGVNTKVTSFLNDDELIGIYDNTIKARTYISYFAEQSGAIATIDRDGDLIFVYLNNLTTQNIPLDYVEKYEDGDDYTITRVVYEDGVRKYETGTETGDTLFLNTANPYISSQPQVESIHQIVQNFSINSFKTGKILGNPAIDPYDLISITEDNKTFVTLANHTLTYNGVIISTYETQISLEKRTENVSLNGEEQFRKWAKTEINNINGSIELNAGYVETIQNELNENYYTIEQTESLVVDAVNGVVNTFNTIGGGNLIKDSMGALQDGSWTDNVTTIRDTYTLENSIASQGIILMNGTIEQQIQLPNEIHTLSFKYKKMFSTANVKLYINDTEYVLDQTETTEFVQQVTISNNTLNIKFTSDTDASCYILDLMLNLGETKDTWSQNANETTTSTVKIGSYILVENSNNNTYWRADADGSRVFNKVTNEVVQEATDKGTKTNELVSQSTSIINGVLFAKVGTHRWISGV